jgi:3'(2'), 5'-bisphosphate nucleotidase
VPTLSSTDCAALMEELTQIAARAAGTILDLAATATEARSKADGSPVTAADEAAEAVICDGLARLAPDLPIISEERTARDGLVTVARSGSCFVVDPLDGTREFIAGRDEYTINIALLTDAVPMLGIICAPALGCCWRGLIGRGADRLPHGPGGGAPIAIQSRKPPAAGLTVLVSRSHLDTQTRAYVDAIAGAKLMASGSALKFCRLAEGAADLYPRLAPTRDWDVAAGHAILTAAGGSIRRPDGGDIAYFTPGLRIPQFIARGGFTD